MKIHAPDTLRPPGSPVSRSTARASGGGFLQELSGLARGTTASAGSSAAAAVSGPMSLLVAQEVDEVTLQRRRAKRRAEALLDRLEDLRRDLLLGTIPHWKLKDLARLVESERAEVDDPRLEAVLEEIDLRAQVELAKWEAGRMTGRDGGQ
ncbi:MAG: flagellar assembly protein FliX [Alphaproteobacteria bacterium]|nr:flagellar assembly protein FliX [Alphaproteobacteria bacterium]